MNDAPVTLFTFSASGNTLLAAQRFVAGCATRGVPVALRPLQAGLPAAAEDTVLGLAVPVAMFSTYRFIWQWLRALPPGNGRPVVALATCAGSSLGGLWRPLGRLLRRRGYRPVAGREMRFPSNVFYIAGEAFNRRCCASGLAATTRLTEEYLAGDARWPGLPLVGDFMGAVSQGCVEMAAIGWHQRLFHLTADPGTCTACGACAHACPVGNITVTAVPRFAAHCEYCLRCAAVCPAAAIRPPCNWRGRRYRAPESII
jgi:NAD-dependent dihydropyrimidine dehydrogenase PreA subunit